MKLTKLIAVLAMSTMIGFTGIQATTAVTAPSVTAQAATKTDYSEKTFKKVFLSELNKERAKHGLKKLKLSKPLSKVSKVRSGQIISHFTHYKANGTPYVNQVLKQKHVAKSSWRGECIQMGTFFGLDRYSGVRAVDKHLHQNLKQGTYTDDAKGFAKKAVFAYLYEDASAHYGHRKNLLNKKAKTIGIALTVKQYKGMLTGFNAVETGV